MKNASDSGERIDFDAFADDYDRALAQGLKASGESKEYFARGRVRFLQTCLTQLDVQARNVLDYGCGTGSATPYLHELSTHVVGVDVSARSLEVARQTFGANAEFHHIDEHAPRDKFDLAFCNGVFHHIPPDQRAGAVNYVFRALRPGGAFAFWENNPWNPGTRFVMDRCPFDSDAQTLTPPQARALLQAGGFQVLRTDFLFIFPAALRALRPLELPLSRWPLGGQYQVLCRRPEERAAL